MHNEDFSNYVDSKVQKFYDTSSHCYVLGLESDITIDEIQKQLDSMKCNKSPRPDRIQNEHLKYGGKHVRPLHCNIEDFTTNIFKCSRKFFEIIKNGIVILYRHGFMVRWCRHCLNILG